MSRLLLSFLIAITTLLLTGSPTFPHGGGLDSYGCPSETPVTNNLIIREIYVLSSNDTTKFADWVAYKITRETIGPSRKRTWKADPLLAEYETLEPSDYKDAHALLGTDRGHQVPLASFTGTPHWKETNYLSNITPQRNRLNRELWAAVEHSVRRLAQQPGIDEQYLDRDQ